MTKLERLRREAGLTQEELAEKSGVSRGVISRIERTSIETVLVKNLVLLAKALSVEPWALF
jgi:transcriptional regulator with XRE-family HTH domain